MSRKNRQKLYWLLFLFVSAFVLLGGGHRPVQAQATAPALTEIQQLRVQVMPEFDDPRVLVIVQGRLNVTEAELPVTLTVAVPRAAQVNQMAVMNLGTGQMEQRTYEALPDPESADWSLVSYELDGAHFFYEYYYDPFAGGDEKAFTYTFHTIHPVGADLLIEVLEPRAAGDFTLTPPSTVSRFDELFELTYHQFTVGVLPAGESYPIDISYVRSETEPSVSRQELAAAQPSTGELPSLETGSVGSGLIAAPLATAPAQSNWFAENWVPILFFVGMTAAVAAFAWSRRHSSGGSGWSPAAARSASMRCPVCDQPLRRGARFCDECGAETVRPTAAVALSTESCPACAGELLADAAFCHHCGEPVPVAAAAAIHESLPGHCRNCEAEMEPSARFCTHCGTPAAASATATTSELDYEDDDDLVAETGFGARLRAGLANKRLVTGVIVLLFVGILAATSLRPEAMGLADAPLDRELMVAGAQVYVAYCGECHGSQAEGNVGPALGGTGDTFLMSDDELQEMVSKGYGEMPGWSDQLSPQQIDAVIYFLKRQWSPEQRRQQANLS
ncbi:MAG: zinc ribbon domain-containing protein [Ardenticatenales bacterium]|nr:zinc ribbon domain-containing protein [Ardenticatenales bacterium]